MSCEVYRELLPAYLDESLDEVRRTGFRSHLRSCVGCREFAIGEEPTLVFSLADAVDPSPDRIEACVTAVVAGIHQERLERRLRGSRRPWLAAAAAVVLAIVAASMWWLKSDDGVSSPTLQANDQGVEISSPVATEEIPAATEPPPRVEVEMVQEEVRVYQYAIGDDGTTGAVFIVNPAMEL